MTMGFVGCVKIRQLAVLQQTNSITLPKRSERDLEGYDWITYVEVANTLLHAVLYRIWSVQCHLLVFDEI